jgi:enamine deaminase RidA (YjgF/YER057c/UK114 family)
MYRVSTVVVSLALLALARPLAGQASNPEARLRELGLTLPSPSPPVANYVNAVRVGNLLYLGRDVTVDSAYASARRTGLCLLSTLKAELGDLRRVRRVVKVFGMVNATPEFVDHPRVINGCSDLLVQVFGERGRHARAAVGMASLPSNIPVEIEMVVEVDDQR